MNHTEFYTKLLTLPNGAYDVHYLGKRYLLRKERLLDGKLLKIYAEELGGNYIVSGNYQQMCTCSKYACHLTLLR